MNNIESWITYYGQLALYDAQGLWIHIASDTLIWAAATILIPLLILILLFLSMADDFIQLIRLRLDFSRFFGDLWHVFFLLLIGFSAEVFSIYMLVKDLF